MYTFDNRCTDCKYSNGGKCIHPHAMYCQHCSLWAPKEYIEREALIAEYDRVHVGPAGGARKLMVEAPIADVAPRAEVANKICCEIEEEIVAALESNYRALKKWDDGRCNDYILEMVNRIKGKIDALRGIEAFVEELKNKYAEVQK